MMLTHEQIHDWLQEIQAELNRLGEQVDRLIKLVDGK